MHADSTHPSDEHLLLGLSHDLSARAQERVDAHVAVCDDCRRRLEEFRAAESALARVVTRIPPNDSDALRRRLAHTMANPDTTASASRWPAGRGPTRGPIGLGIAAILVVTAASGVIWRLRPQNQATREHASAHLSLPIASLTPGATTDVSMDLICAPTEPPPPPVPSDMRQHVLRSYAMDDVPHDEFELDYLITPQLGGVTQPANLWPERYDSPVWNAKVKDQLETLLPALVCAGALDLADAQREIATDWIAAYKKYFNSDRPLRPGAVVPGRETPEAVASHSAPLSLLTMARMGP